MNHPSKRHQTKMSTYKNTNSFNNFDFDAELKTLIAADSNYAKLHKKCKKYVSNTKYVFKSCYNKTKKTQYPERKWLVVMEKLSSTITNEDRESLKDARFAKFRANELKVVKIINMTKPGFAKTKIRNYYEDDITIYEVGEIVKPNSYDIYKNEVCSNGIHYFKTLMPAYFYGYKKSAKFYEWYDDGNICIVGQYKNNIKTGEWRYYYGVD